MWRKHVDTLMISIHAPRTGSDGNNAVDAVLRGISIHAPRTGSDREYGWRCSSGCHFNPRSPHGERHTHAVRIWGYAGDFNPRSPHGERPRFPVRLFHVRAISIHAPRTGSDIFTGLPLYIPSYFNPRSPHGERQARLRRYTPSADISIHAPRTGSDLIRSAHMYTSSYFNPRSPHGERRHSA